MIFTESITVLKDYPKVSGGWRGVWVAPGDLGVDLCEIVLALGGGVGECEVDGGFPCYCICRGLV